MASNAFGFASIIYFPYTENFVPSVHAGYGYAFVRCESLTEIVQMY